MSRGLQRQPDDRYGTSRLRPSSGPWPFCGVGRNACCPAARSHELGPPPTVLPGRSLYRRLSCLAARGRWLLLLYGVGLLVCHVSDHADEIDGTIAFASRGVDANRPSLPRRSDHPSSSVRSSGRCVAAVPGGEACARRDGRGSVREGRGGAARSTVWAWGRSARRRCASRSHRSRAIRSSGGGPSARIRCSDGPDTRPLELLLDADALLPVRVVGGEGLARYVAGGRRRRGALGHLAWRGLGRRVAWAQRAGDVGVARERQARGQVDAELSRAGRGAWWMLACRWRLAEIRCGVAADPVLVGAGGAKVLACDVDGVAVDRAGVADVGLLFGLRPVAGERCGAVDRRAGRGSCAARS